MLFYIFPVLQTGLQAEVSLGNKTFDRKGN